MTPSRRPASPNYTARRILFGFVAVLLLVVVVGAVAWAVAGPVSALLDPAATAPAPRTGVAVVPDTAATSDPAHVSTAATETPSSAASSAAASETSAPASVTIASVGDMMFGRGVADYIRSNGGKALFSKVAGALNEADLTLGNLEGPLARGGTAAAGKDVTLLGDPKAIAGLTSAGFDAVGLANNHALDFGEPALRATLTLLDDAGIAHSGAGMHWAEARKPAALKANGARVAFLSFSEIIPDGFAATDSKPGIARARQRMDQVQASIRDAKKAHDYVVVMFHWGVEYKPDANSDQRADAHKAVDAGADLVLGAHPHVVQGLESYKGRLIAYSLGDFVFDHYSRATGETVVLEIEMPSAGPPSFRITPVYLSESHGIPHVVTGAEAGSILRRISGFSADLGLQLTVTDDRAVFSAP